MLCGDGASANHVQSSAEATQAAGWLHRAKQVGYMRCCGVEQGNDRKVMGGVGDRHVPSEQGHARPVRSSGKGRCFRAGRTGAGRMQYGPARVRAEGAKQARSGELTSGGAIASPLRMSPPLCSLPAAPRGQLSHTPQPRAAAAMRGGLPRGTAAATWHRTAGGIVKHGKGRR
jgi:hypothetical protein